MVMFYAEIDVLFFFKEKINLSLIKRMVHNKPPYRCTQNISKRCISHLSQKTQTITDRNATNKT
jgi:hypothetical protein